MPGRRSILDRAKAADLRPRSAAARRLHEALDWVGGLFRRSRRGDGSEAERHIRLMAEDVENRNWQAARDHALALGLIGERLGDPNLIKKAGRGLRRLGGANRAWQLIALSKRVSGRREWDGGDVSGRTLLLDRREGDLAIFLQFASLLGPAVAVAGRCIVLVEPRLAPLYRRTFPSLDVRIEGDATSGADVFASFETLAEHFWPDEPDGRAPFVPLLPDHDVVASLRARYLDRGEGPLIGFAWGSLNKSKDLPTLDDWRSLLAGTAGHFISLQYGDVGPALAEFERLAPGRIIHDDSVDQLSDMDRFAAQLAAMDAVVTISNTGAHLAGALGVPAVVLLDDGFRLSWPAFGETMAAYPGVRLVHKAGRTWRSAMGEAAGKVSSIVSGSAHVS